MKHESPPSNFKNDRMTVPAQVLDGDKESWPMKVASTAATLGTPNKSVESVKATKPEVSFKREPQATSVDEPAADAVEVSNVVEDRIVGVEDSNLTAAVETAISEEQEHTEAGAAMPTLQWSKLALTRAHTNPTSNKDL